MIINESKDALQELKERKAKRAKVPQTYMQKQYARANEKANAIKHHNEQQLQQLKDKNI